VGCNINIYKFNLWYAAYQLLALLTDRKAFRIRTCLHKTQVLPRCTVIWSNVPPTVDGMLGGFAYITTTDVKFKVLENFNE